MELTWWIENIRKANGSQIAPPPELIIFTNASKMGWDAVCYNVKTNGKWSFQESLLHINILELKGAF